MMIAIVNDLQKHLKNLTLFEILVIAIVFSKNLTKFVALFLSWELLFSLKMSRLNLILTFYYQLNHDLFSVFNKIRRLRSIRSYFRHILIFCVVFLFLYSLCYHWHFTFLLKKEYCNLPNFVSCLFFRYLTTVW